MDVRAEFEKNVKSNSLLSYVGYFVESIGNYCVFVKNGATYCVAEVNRLTHYQEFEEYSEAISFALILSYTANIMPLPNGAWEEMLEFAKQTANSLDKLADKFITAEK